MTPVPAMGSDSKDLSLANAGKRRVEWAFQSMPVLQSIRKQFIKKQPLAGIRIAACQHVTPETANLMITLRDGGASLVLCAASSLSTQEDVAASLVRDCKIPVYAFRAAGGAEFHSCLEAALDHQPHITMDDGGELVAALHTKRRELLENVRGGTEETTTGVLRLRAMVRKVPLAFPVIAVNESPTKRLFDSRFGTGQSVLDGVLRATNFLLAGLTVVVAGYGWCGRGVAVRARGLGGNVIVTEVDPIKALEALLDGCRVMSMGEAAQIGDLFITATGNRHVISREHMEKMKAGAILANAGHSNVEIDVAGLGRMANSKRFAREFVDEYAMRDGRRLYLLSEGRMINLAAAEGHPASVMDMSFANQALSVEHLLKQQGTLENKVYSVPEDIDRQVAKMKLEAMAVKIDRLSIEQERYQAGWAEGT